MKTPPRESRVRVLELVELYRRTRYEVTLPQGTLATLCIGEPAPPMLARWIGADGFAIYLTACNPHSVALTKAQNDSRLARLRTRLRALGARWLEGVAGIEEDTWLEPSLLVGGVPAARCDRLAFEFQQNASVGVDASAPARLRIYRQDWRGALHGASDIDWIER